MIRKSEEIVVRDSENSLCVQGRNMQEGIQRCDAREV